MPDIEINKPAVANFIFNGGARTFKLVLGTADNPVDLTGRVVRFKYKIRNWAEAKYLWSANGLGHPADIAVTVGQPMPGQTTIEFAVPQTDMDMLNSGGRAEFLLWHVAANLSDPHNLLAGQFSRKRWVP